MGLDQERALKLVEEPAPGGAVVPARSRTMDLERRAPRAALAAGLQTVAAGAVLAGHLPFWLQRGFEGLLQAFRGVGFGWEGALAMGNGVLMLGALLFTWLMAKAVAPAIRAAATRSPVEGRAAAAGACMAGAGLCAVGIAGAHLLDLHYLGGTGLWLLVLRLGGAALGVGLFGAHLFRLAGADTRLGPTPPLYTFLSGAGLATAVGLFGLGFLGIAPSGLGAMAFLAGSSVVAGLMALAGRSRRPAEIPSETT